VHFGADNIAVCRACRPGRFILWIPQPQVVGRGVMAGEFVTTADPADVLAAHAEWQSIFDAVREGRDPPTNPLLPTYRDAEVAGDDPVLLGFTVVTRSAAAEISEARRLSGEAEARRVFDRLLPSQPFVDLGTYNSLIAGWAKSP